MMSERKTDQQSVQLYELIEQVAKETNRSVAEVIQAALEHAQDSKKKS